MAIATSSLEEIIKQVVMKEISKSNNNVNNATSSEKKLVPVGVSARHLHVTREDLDILYGKGHELTRKKELMGGQFAAEEKVTIIGTNLRVIENVRILGPERSKTQVEISKTDAIKLGINPPIRESGNIAGSAPIVIVGPEGAVALKEGCIIAKRHIHMNEDDAKYLGVKDNDIVSVKIKDSIRKGILDNVQVRVDPSFTLEMHIDTDEANALGIKCKDKVEIVND